MGCLFDIASGKRFEKGCDLQNFGRFLDEPNTFPNDSPVLEFVQLALLPWEKRWAAMRQRLLDAVSAGSSPGSLQRAANPRKDSAVADEMSALKWFVSVKALSGGLISFEAPYEPKVTLTPWLIAQKAGTGLGSKLALPYNALGSWFIHVEGSFVIIAASVQHTQTTEVQAWLHEMGARSVQVAMQQKNLRAYALNDENPILWLPCGWSAYVINEGSATGLYHILGHPANGTLQNASARRVIAKSYREFLLTLKGDREVMFAPLKEFVDQIDATW